MKNTNEAYVQRDKFQIWGAGGGCLFNPNWPKMNAKPKVGAGTLKQYENERGD